MNVSLRWMTATLPAVSRYNTHPLVPDGSSEITLSHSAFDTLGAARKLKAAGIEAEQADVIVEAMGQSVNQLVTVERFDAGLAVLESRIDAVRTELRAEILRSQVISVGIMIAANALMMTILGVVLTNTGGM